MRNIALLETSIDIQSVVDDFNVHSERLGCGAILSFSGVARADQLGGEGVKSLTLEYYPGMTEKALENLVEKVFARWPIKACTIVHRVGEVAVGEAIILVLLASKHRKDSINALDFIMDFLKNDVPLWKKEHTDTQSHWAEQKNSDKAAKSRW